MVKKESEEIKAQEPKNEVKEETKVEEVKEEKPKKIEVVYTKAKLGKRMLAHIIDVGSLFVLGVLLFTGLHYVNISLPYYSQKTAELSQAKNESGIYINDTNLIQYMDSHSGEYSDYTSRKNLLSTRIDAFYSNTTYFSSDLVKTEYRQRKVAAKATIEGTQVEIFVKNEGNVEEKEGISAEVFYNFYKAEYENYTLAYLVNNPTYLRLTQFAFLSEVVVVIIAVTISFALVYLILPLTAFKRGRQTLGMKLNKIGLITVRAINEPAYVYIGRFFFNYLIFIPLNFVSFLIPSFVSLGMMFFSKTNSSLTSYVFNDYMVDVDLKKIYMNEAEREFAEEELKKIRLENKDLVLK